MLYFLLYNIFLILTLPFYIAYYCVLSFKNIENLNLLIQNFSFFYKSSLFLSKNDRPIWIHASSVGEVTALKPLIIKLLQDNCKIIISSMTITGRSQVTKLFNKKVLSIYKPYDLKFFVSLCLKKINPSTFIVMETELWPNLIKQVHLKKIPLYLINARLSDRSLSYYKKIPSFVKTTLNFFDYIFAQSKLDEQKFLSLGAKKENLSNAGNIKYDICLPDNLNKVSLDIQNTLFAFAFAFAFAKNFDSKDINIKKEKSATNIWIAASTHHSEEDSLIKINQNIRKSQPNTLLILAPRHPERFSAVIKLCEKKNINYVTRSSKKTCDNNTEVFILDSLGELIYFYKLSKIAFIGGSLVSIGGHNPLEAIAVNTPTVWGPYMFNFLEIKNLLLKNNLGQEALNEKNLESIIENGLKDNNKKDFTTFLKSHSGTTQTIHNKIKNKTPTKDF
ncbi:MAG: 3-deoxy-D-manno-octulosonic acid transferase [Bdellovibrionales bacterium]|nr:3-deoxy-D-manno-octulosonic acid transferase [Bdellovibrionales bacterium]